MDKDDKLVLLEHLRQLNDTLTRLSSRRRRLRADVYPFVCTNCFGGSSCILWITNLAD